MERDFTEANKILSQSLKLPYRVVIKGAWSMFVGVLGNQLMKEFNPVHKEDSVIYTRESEDIKELEKDKKDLENFIYGDVDQIKENERAKKILSNRAVASVYNKIKKFIKNQTDKKSILTLMNSCSIFIKWEIIQGPQGREN